MLLFLHNRDFRRTSSQSANKRFTRLYSRPASRSRQRAGRRGAILFAGHGSAQRVTRRIGTPKIPERSEVPRRATGEPVPAKINPGDNIPTAGAQRSRQDKLSHPSARPSPRQNSDTRHKEYGLQIPDVSDVPDFSAQASAGLRSGKTRTREYRGSAPQAPSRPPAAQAPRGLARPAALRSGFR